MSLESKLIQYRDAGYPIIFVETYEEEKFDRVITKIAKTARISVMERGCRCMRFCEKSSQRHKEDVIVRGT